MMRKKILQSLKKYIFKNSHNPPISPIFLLFLHLRPLNRIFQRMRLKDYYFRFFIFGKALKKNSYRIKSTTSNKDLNFLFNSFGFLVIESLFNKNDLKIINKEEYLPNQFFSDQKLSGYVRGNLIPIVLIEKIVDQRIISVLKRPGLNLYFRSLPYITFTNIKKDFVDKTVPTNFHLDAPDQVRATILLNKINKYSPKMQILLRSNNFTLVPLNEIIDCTGSFGTTVFHNGNIFHRLSINNNSKNRLTLNLSFTYDISKIAKLNNQNKKLLLKGLSKKSWDEYDDDFKKLFKGLI